MLILMLQASWTRKVVAPKAVAMKKSPSLRAESTCHLQTTQAQAHLFADTRARETSPKVLLPQLSGTANRFAWKRWLSAIPKVLFFPS